MRKNFKMKKTLIGASMLAALSLGTVNAQWSVIDVNSNAMKTTLENIQDGVAGTINELQGVRKIQEAQVKQTDQYQEDTDRRNRLAYGTQESIRRDLDAMPTLQQCAEMTNRSFNSSGVQAAFSGGGAGSRTIPGTKEYAQSKIVNNSTAQASLLQNVVTAQTCGGGMDAGINGCGAAPSTYGGADVNASSLRKEYSSRLGGTGPMTNSLNANGIKAAEIYAQNATLYAAPPEVEVDKVRKNPAYVSVYKPVITKLNAAYEALAEIISLRKAPTAIPSGIAGQKWEADKANYKATFGVDAPPIPSFFDALNFAVMRDYAGPPKTAEISDPIKLAQELNEKITLSNVIAIQQFKATETTNILLAHLLTQSVAPTNIDTVKAEAAKTKNLN